MVPLVAFKSLTQLEIQTFPNLDHEMISQIKCFNKYYWIRTWSGHKLSYKCFMSLVTLHF